MNIPYYKEIYNQYLNMSNPLGRYLSRMRLGNLYDLEYKDTIFLSGSLMEITGQSGYKCENEEGDNV
jgi:hypothetical protein